MSEQAYGVRLPTGQPKSVIEPAAAWPLAVGAVLGIVGGAGPWADIDKLHLTRTGFDEGFLPFAISIVVGALAALIFVRRGAAWVAVTAIVLGAINFVLAMLEAAAVDGDLVSKFGKSGDLTQDDVSLDWGLYLVIASAVVVVVSAALALRRRTARPAAK